MSDASGDDKVAEKKDAEKKDAKKDKKAPPPEKDVATEHAITIGGRTAMGRMRAFFSGRT